MQLLNDKITYEQISLQTINKNIDVFNKFYKKLIIKEDSFSSSLIDYDPTISNIYCLLKTHKPEIPPQPIIFGMG